MAAEILNGVESKGEDSKASYNVAPSQPILTLTNDKVFHPTRFGLIPHWSKDGKFQPINARSETITEKPTFKSSFKSRRCLIPVNGFYEWKKGENHKVPYYISPKHENFFALAGVSDSWTNPETGEIIESSAILTTTSNEVMRPIHDRMPVILTPENWSLWLDPAVKESEVLVPLLVPCEDDLIQSYEVSTFVNTPANNTEACIQRASNGLYSR